MTASQTFGRFPTLAEIKAHYDREDVLEALYDASQSRNLYAALHRRHWELHPTGKEQLRDTIQAFIQQRIETFHPDDSVRLAPCEYPSFHSTQDITRDGALIGFDLFLELDLPGWRRCFEALSELIGLFEQRGICYRMKYSGVRSLHLMIPFEAFPTQFQGQPILSLYEQVIQRLKRYLSRYCEGRKVCGTRFLRLAYSLNEDNGLVSLPLTLEELVGFRPWQAHLHHLGVADKPWHGGVPADAWRSTLCLLEEAFRGDIPIPPRHEETRRRFYPSVSLPQQPSTSAELNPQHLIEGLGSPVPSERVQAAWYLMGASESVPLPALKQALADENPDVRWYLTEALQCYPQSQVQELALVQLQDADSFVRLSACDVLAHWRVDPVVCLAASLRQNQNKEGNNADWLTDVLYLLEKHLRQLLDSGAMQEGNALEDVAGRLVAKTVACLLDSDQFPVHTWMKPLKEMSYAYHRPMALMLPAIEPCVRKLTKPTGEREIAQQRYVDMLDAMQRSELVCLLLLHALADGTSLADLGISINRRIGRGLACHQHQFNQMVDFMKTKDEDTQEGSEARRIRVLVRLALYGGNRTRIGSRSLLTSSPWGAQATRIQVVRAEIRNIGTNAWRSLVTRLRETQGSLSAEIEKQIHQGRSLLESWADAQPLEELTDALEQLSESIRLLQRALWRRQQHRRAVPVRGEELGWMPHPTLEELPAILDAMQQEEAPIRQQAVNALGRIGGKQAMEVVLQALADGNKQVRHEAINAVGLFGEEAVPALMEVASAQNGRQSSYAILALGQLGDARALPVLLASLKHPSLVFNATVALGQLGNVTVIPALTMLRSHERQEIRQQAEEALRKIRTQ